MRYRPLDRPGRLRLVRRRVTFRGARVGALTAGYLFNFLETKAGVFGVGADLTGYSVPENLQDSYGSPSSYHVFVHYSLRGQSAAHVH